MKQSSIANKVVGIAVVIIVLCTALSAWFALQQIKTSLQPAEQEKASVLALSTERLINKMMGYGIPFQQMGKLDEVLESRLQGHHDLRFLAITKTDGTILYQAHNNIGKNADQTVSTALEGRLQHIQDAQALFVLYSYDLSYNGQNLGQIWIGFDLNFMQQVFEEIGYDIATILVVSLLLAMELLMFITTYHIRTPLSGLTQMLGQTAQGDYRQVIHFPGKDELSRLGNQVSEAITQVSQWLSVQNPKGQYQLPEQKPEQVALTKLSFVRPPLFLVIFSESMSLSFFPAYVMSVYKPIEGLSTSMVIGLPISLFMLIWALSLPFAGQWSDRVGRRTAFMVGAGLTAIGLLLTALCTDLWQLLVVRSITAIGYGIVFITAQGYVTDNTTMANRTRGMAMFLSGFFSGSLCGAAIGGILSDRIGFQWTFILSAGLSLMSALFVVQFFEAKKKVAAQTANPATQLSWRDFALLFSDKYFLLITFLSAVPAKLLLTGFLYYSGPVYLSQLGANQSAVGRILMAYGLAIVLISPLSAWLGDKLKKKTAFIIFGGALSAVAILFVYLVDGIVGMFGGVLLLGIAHAVGVSPQLALLTEKVRMREGLTLGKTIGIFRLTERIGNIAGPIVAATLISFLGFQYAFLWLASGVAASLMLLVVLYLLFKTLDKPVPVMAQ
ncbi:Predicted arabinose efflux permease, MFS family [Oceanospirillum multiglobuliferum]|uniref:Major facilitator superfamily (MFS) profile domain-containing protein n=1 Tax=Oceanospirillum multiglobuliferum TaxID=64969 RepID=A0A1T4MUE4_9GAMM|nr:MFS transporter [Oceanospirillum multiglobuliferum]OPX56892.1 hypothetical protein BTE48_00195 [Oceanospirillum multiglobuliferum]SJZ70447.1 Predicted arabinose efflux permease, MFS family [Oceanospirillum multiglobuliferum]